MHLILTALLFLVYAANVMAGAFAGRAFLNEVAAFLVLLVTSIVFVAATLRAEKRSRLPRDEDEGPKAL